MNENSKAIQEYTKMVQMVHNVMEGNINFVENTNKNIDILDENFKDVYKQLGNIRGEINSLKNRVL